ncbi:MAG: hypothetical protein NC924_03120 [Candidatus Omnitrophica bacterium]|nr:hypothetical protein [Candidatus Omnitrophota bacterium]
MTITMNKELLIRMPATLYNRAKKVCGSRSKSLSAFIRDLLVEGLDDYLTEQERQKVTKGEKAYRQGKGVSWRTVKRG